MRSVRFVSRAAAVAFASWSFPLAAQQFTTAAEVKPMLDITRAKWVSLREFDGNDQLHFDQLLKWRCGIDQISYAVNNGKKTRLKVEACHEGETRPKMMTIGLHARLIGRPGRIGSLHDFLDYLQKHDRLWICRRNDLATYWAQNYPNRAG